MLIRKMKYFFDHKKQFQNKNLTVFCHIVWNVLSVTILAAISNILMQDPLFFLVDVIVYIYDELPKFFAAKCMTCFTERYDAFNGMGWPSIS